MLLFSSWTRVGVLTSLLYLSAIVKSDLHNTNNHQFSQSSRGYRSSGYHDRQSRRARAAAVNDDALEPAFFFGSDNENIQRNTWMTVQPSNQGPQPTAGAAMATWYSQPDTSSGWGGPAFANTTTFKYGNFVMLMHGGIFLKTPKQNPTVDTNKSTAPQQSSLKIGSEMFAMRLLSGFWSERSFLSKNPGPRVYHTMNQCGDGRYVNGTQKLVLFGGIATLGGNLALNTFILDDDGMGVANSRWSVSTTTTNPPLRYHHMTITLRPFSRNVFLFGGTNNPHIGNLFQSHADRWSHYSPVEQEEPDMSGMTVENSLFNDTWVYNAIDDEWSELTLPDPPTQCGSLARAAAGASISGHTWFMIGGYSESVDEDDDGLVLWYLELDGVDGLPTNGWQCQHYLQPMWPDVLGSFAHLPVASVVGGILVNVAEIPVLVPPPDTPLGASDTIIAPAPLATWLGFCGGSYAHVGNLFTRVGCLILDVRCITNATTECAMNLQTQLADETIIGKIIVLPFAAKTLVQIGLNVANVVFGGTNGVLGYSDQMQIVMTQETPTSSAMFEVPRVSQPPQAPFAQAAAMMVGDDGHPNMFLVSNGRGGNQELIEPELYILRSPRGTGKTSWTPVQNKKNNSFHPTMNEVVSSIEPVAAYNPSAIKVFVIVTNYAIYNVSIYPACQDWYVTECQPFYPGALWHLLRVIDVPPLEIFGIMFLYAQSDTVVVKINKTATEVYSVRHPTKPSYPQIYRGAPFIWQGGAVNKYVENNLNELCVVAVNDTTYYAGQLVGNGSFFWGEQTSDKSAQQGAALPQSVVFLNSWYSYGGVQVQTKKMTADNAVGVQITNMFGTGVWSRNASSDTNGLTVSRAFYNVSTNKLSRTSVHVQVAGNTVGFSPESYGGAAFASLAANTRDVIVMQMGGFSKSGFQSSTLNSVPVIYLTCNAGQFSTNFSIVPCQYCPHGTYSNAVGAKSCVDCGGGTTTPDVGSLNITSCNLCQENYCHGNGICQVETFGVARCTCYGGYTGVQCSTESVNLALVIPLVFVGVAIVMVVGYVVYKRASRPIKTFHIFISYRVFSEASLARKVARKFREMELEENMKVECYLDQKNIESGTDWEKSFMEGLQRSCLFVPLISEQGTKPIESVSCFDEKADNLLMEYETALKMNKNCLIGIYPLLVGSVDELGKYEKFGPHNFDVSRFSNGPSTTRKEAPVRQTMKELFKFQGDFISPSGLEDVQAEQMLSHLREKIWKSKDVDCMKLHRMWVVAQDLHTRADTRFQRLATVVSSPSSSSSSSSSSTKKTTDTNKPRAPTWSKAPWESDLEASLLEEHAADTTL